MTKKDLYEFVLSFLEGNMPQKDSELKYSNSYELLICVILSAQCTDKRINQITPNLFKRYPNVQSLAKATYEEVFPYIKSISYPNSKTRYLIESAKIIERTFKGAVPNNMKDLTSLPGVGRKTANVVLSIAFRKATLAVDTHVFRVSHRLGLVPDRCTTPLSVERELIKHIPKEKISQSHFWLLYLGRYTCLSRNPKCENCGLRNICLYFKKHKA